jgi:hypothetical protein
LVPVAQPVGMIAAERERLAGDILRPPAREIGWLNAFLVNATYGSDLRMSCLVVRSTMKHQRTLPASPAAGIV